jgi:hypothetical protein
MVHVWLRGRVRRPEQDQLPVGIERAGGDVLGAALNGEPGHAARQDGNAGDGRRLALARQPVAAGGDGGPGIRVGIEIPFPAA